MELPLGRFEVARHREAGAAYRDLVTRYPHVRGFRPLGDPAHFHFSVNSLRLGEAMITTGTSGGFAFSEAAEARVTIVLPLRRSVQLTAAGRELTGKPDTALLVTGADDAATRYEPGFAGAFLTVPREALEERLQAWSEDERAELDFSSRELPARSGRGLLIAEAIRSSLGLIDAAGDLDREGLAAFRLDELLIQAAALALRPSRDPERPPAPAAGRRQVAAALAFMEANLRESLRLSDIAAAVGVSPRALQAAFQREHSFSPMQRLRDLRMRATYDALATARPGETVASIARAHGFANLGDFSIAFRQRFGRTPSQVLRRIV